MYIFYIEFVTDLDMRIQHSLSLFPPFKSKCEHKECITLVPSFIESIQL